ncbi:hypothetical protein GF342_03770 [Candidatus Woesearchaeota archaeon]|nr:hypothetical protein [Candidatus Woesearchaeota archaeon]
MGEMENTVITYETIYEFLRSEKNKDELQRLNPAFFEDIAHYLAQKEKMLRDSKDKNDVFSQKETRRIEKQLENVRAILSDIYTRREKKIIDMAVNMVRTQSAVVDTSHIHKREKPFFDALLSVLEQYRSSTLKDLLTAKERTSEPKEKVKTPQGTKVEFLEDVDTFIDTDLNEFGPFSPGDAAVIPTEIAQILAGEGKAKIL